MAHSTGAIISLVSAPYASLEASIDSSDFYVSCPAIEQAALQLLHALEQNPTKVVVESWEQQQDGYFLVGVEKRPLHEVLQKLKVRPECAVGSGIGLFGLRPSSIVTGCLFYADPGPAGHDQEHAGWPAQGLEGP